MSSNDSASLNMLQTLGIALGLSLLLGVAASFRDLTCLEGFDLIADSGKGTVLVGAMLFALGRPLLFAPVLLGFFGITLISLRFPYLFRPGTFGRTLGAFAPIALLFFGVLWMIFLAPVYPCAVQTGIRLLGYVVAASLAVLGLVFVLRVRDRSYDH